MLKNKKAISMALAAMMTAGTVFNGTLMADAASKTKSGLTSTQMANYNKAVTAVVVLENGIKKYGLTKTENIAYSQGKSVLAKAALAKCPAGSSKNGLLARVAKCDTLIANTAMANYKESVTAVVVLENGIKKYGLIKPENIAYSKTKSALAKAALAKCPAGSSKNGLLARVAKCDVLIEAADPNGSTIVSVENPADMIVAQGATCELPATVKATMSDNTTKDIKVVWDKTVDTSKLGDVTLTGKVEGTDKTVTLKVTVKKIDAEVTNITPLNLKQVKIEFNIPIVDGDLKRDIEDKDNYSLYKDKDEQNDIVKEVKIDESNKFAILTFADQYDSKDKHYAIENQEKYSLVIDEDVFGKEVRQDITFKDTDLPKVEGMEVVGEDTIKVKFSEPIMPYNFDKIVNDSDLAAVLDKDDFSINGGDISINRVELVNDNKEANIVVGTRLKDGEKVKVKARGTIHDYAGFSVVAEEQELTVKKDTNTPEIVGYKDVESNSVTIVFDKDIKFKGTDDTLMDATHNSGSLKNFYHSSDNSYNQATKAVVDGKELKLEFANGDLPVGTAYVYVKSEALESRWGVKNDKVSVKVARAEDNERPTVDKVEQDKDSSNKIHIKFSEKVNLSDTKDAGARKTSNYTIKDEKGKEWKISKIMQDGDSEKEFVIYTTKDLDSDLKYTIEIQNVEDRAGNTVQRVTKDFTVRDTEGVKQEDVVATLHSASTNDQKIVVDFDQKMLTNDDKYSTVDLGKYTLKAYEADGVTEKKAFNDNTKSVVNVADLYKASIRVAKDGRGVEIALPYNKDKLKDDSYDLSKIPVLKMEIAKVQDANGNVTTTAMNIIVTNGSDQSNWIDFDKDNKPETASVDEIHYAWKDKVDFDIEDIKVVAADNEVDAYAAAMSTIDATKTKPASTTILNVSKNSANQNADNYTEVNLTLSKAGSNSQQFDDDYDHVLTYDSKYINDKGEAQKVYLCVVPSDTKNNVTQTQNDYDTPVKTGAFLVGDGVAPVIVDNSNRTSDHRYKGNDVYGSTDIKDEAVEVYQNGEKAAIVMTFEEAIDGGTLSNSTFELNDSSSDFGDANIDKVYAIGNKVVLVLSNVKDGSKSLTISEGAEITQKNSFKDLGDNDITGLKVQVGGFTPLTQDQVPGNTQAKTEALKAVEAELVKLPANKAAADVMNDKVALQALVDGVNAKITAAKAAGATDAEVSAVANYGRIAVTTTRIADITAAEQQAAVNAEAAKVAATLAATGAAQDVKLPAIAEGYTIAVKTTSDNTKYDEAGKIVAAGTSNVVYTVTNTATGKTADTATVVVTVTVQ